MIAWKERSSYLDLNVIESRMRVFLLNGEQMMKEKSLFLKIFIYEGIEGFTPRLSTLIVDSPENKLHNLCTEMMTRFINQFKNPLLLI